MSVYRAEPPRRVHKVPTPLVTLNYHFQIFDFPNRIDSASIHFSYRPRYVRKFNTLIFQDDTEGHLRAPKKNHLDF